MSEDHYCKFSGPGKLVVRDDVMKEAGNFAFFDSGTVTYFICNYFICNFGPTPCCIPVRNHDRAWTWDGNRERPTIAPSIHVIGHWHGFVENGQIRSC